MICNIDLLIEMGELGKKLKEFNESLIFSQIDEVLERNIVNKLQLYFDYFCYKTSISKKPLILVANTSKNTNIEIDKIIFDADVFVFIQPSKNYININISNYFIDLFNCRIY